MSVKYPASPNLQETLRWTPKWIFPSIRRTSPPAARMGGSAAPSAAPSPDIARMLQEFERRIATLEARLDESNEAREKLERQVAAQSEELRVQRAAIARTQRALRTMTRGDEDKATEPALRDGETQAKTRVTP
jgi:septal ring factor EnvC (AmiA/AmiB activator)